MARTQRPPLRWWARPKARAVLAASSRLQLTALRIDDAPTFVDSLYDPEVREWQGYDQAAVDRWSTGFSNSLQLRFRHHPTQLAVRDPTTGALVGYYGYVQDSADLLGDTVILGWWLLTSYRGKGLGSESLQLVLRWLHDEALIGTVRMATRSDNVRALAQIERAGARPRGEHPITLPNGSAPMGKWFTHEL
ncbi:MAG: GNAT family N-acetyltransferase [Ilumatobacteraceae bacterium]